MSPEFAALRRTMVEGQLRTYDVSQTRLIAAMESVPRERFVPEARKAVAYVDQSIALSSLRAMPTPMVFARMVQSLDLEAGESILDVACGSGYSTAVLAAMGMKVTALDDDGSSAGIKTALAGLAGAENVVVVTGPIEKGAADHGPFDAILINGAVESEPAGLFSQLKEGGRLSVVVGAGRSGRAMLYRKSSGHVSGAPVFDAAAPLLAAFRQMRGFVF